MSIFQEPVLGQPGIQMLSPLLASIIARWSAIERQLDRVFILIVDDEPSDIDLFDRLRGWDARSKAIERAAERQLTPEEAARVKAVIRLIDVPARKRHEIAHSVWAVVDGYPDRLALLPKEYDRQVARNLVSAKKAGTCRIFTENADIFRLGRMVSVDHLRALRAELIIAQNRVDALVWGHLAEDWIDNTGNGFADRRAELIGDAEVQARLTAMATERVRRERVARRRSAARPPGDSERSE